MGANVVNVYFSVVMPANLVGSASLGVRLLIPYLTRLLLLYLSMFLSFVCI